jgi:DNA-binding transcriptional ArsR family regulator
MVTRSHDSWGPRAALLRMAAVPMSRKLIAAELAQSAGSVSNHLTVLREAGLVAARRSGKSVLYCQTPLAISIVKAQRP